jgi:hypothetical protein
MSTTEIWDGEEVRSSFTAGELTGKYYTGVRSCSELGRASEKLSEYVNNMVDGYQRFAGTQRLHVQGKSKSKAIPVTGLGGL